MSDLDGDGSLDLATANRNDSTVPVLLNQGNSTFSAQATYRAGVFPLTVTTGDLNGDGHLDLVTANGLDGTVSVLLNAGKGTLTTHTTYRVGEVPISAVMGDLDANSDFLSPTIDITTSDLGSALASPLLSATYFRRVRALSDAGAGGWSSS